MRRARGLPRSTWGTAFAHAGVGIGLIGIVCETTWNSEYIGTMKPDDVATLAGYQLKLGDVTQRQGPNFREMSAPFSVTLEPTETDWLAPALAVGVSTLEVTPANTSISESPTLSVEELTPVTVMSSEVAVTGVVGVTVSPGLMELARTPCGAPEAAR